MDSDLLETDLHIFSTLISDLNISNLNELFVLGKGWVTEKTKFRWQLSKLFELSNFLWQFKLDKQNISFSLLFIIVLANLKCRELLRWRNFLSDCLSPSFFASLFLILSLSPFLYLFMHYICNVRIYLFACTVSLCLS